MSSIQEEITRGLQTTAKSTRESVNELAIQVCKLTAAVGSGQHTVEVASVIRTALSILASTTPGLSPESRLQILFQQLTNQPSTALKIDPTASKVGTPAQAIGRGIRPTDKPPAKVLEVASWPWGQPAAKSDLAQVLGLKPITNVSATQTHIVNHRPEDPVGNRARRVIAEQLGLTIDEVTDDKSFVADFGADSWDLVELCMAFEDEFNVEIDDVEAEQITTVGEALIYARKLSHIRVLSDSGTAQSAAARTSETGRLYVNIRKHPAFFGIPQPTGKRKVTRVTVQNNTVKIGIGDGTQGWTINLALPAPPFLDFIVDTDKGRKVSLAEALEYWKRHNP